MRRRESVTELPIIGWREWLGLPDLGIEQIKAKVDTGARSCSLHAMDLDIYRRSGREFVSFKVLPLQRTKTRAVRVRAPIVEHRTVRSSSGHESSRPVIRTTVHLLGQQWPIDLTLAARDEMGFRMLLGREAIRGRFLVDPQRSFYGGQPKPSARKKGRSAARRTAKVNRLTGLGSAKQGLQAVPEPRSPKRKKVIRRQDP